MVVRQILHFALVQEQALAVGQADVNSAQVQQLRQQCADGRGHRQIACDAHDWYAPCG